MIDIQIFEEERHAGQPVTFKILIGFASQAPKSADPALGLGDFDLTLAIEARFTAAEEDLDGSIDFIQGVFGYDEPCACLPVGCSTSFAQPWPPAARLPLAALE